MKEGKPRAGTLKKWGIGITIKLVAAVVASAIIAVSAFLAVVYDRMSQTLLEKSEEIIGHRDEAVLVVMLLVIIQIRRIIGRPVKELSQAASRIADDELNQTILYIKYIDEISNILLEIAKGNLAYELTNDYTGEFA